MEPHDFLVWLGSQLEMMVQEPVEDNHRFNAAQELVQMAINLLSKMSDTNRIIVRDKVIDYFSTRIIGNYKIRVDIRETYDWIEGVVATIDGYLES